MKPVVIRRAELPEVNLLQKIAQQTFSETFSGRNTGENMKKYLENGFSLEKLTTELSDKNSEFYFALSGNEIVGYLKLNFGSSQTELKDENALEIERIYVLKAYHGKDIGKRLFEKAVQVAKLKNADYAWLGVWEENTRAINFYKKNGFIEFDTHIFRLGDDEQTDSMMKLQLKDTSEA